MHSYLGVISSAKGKMVPIRQKPAGIVEFKSTVLCTLTFYKKSPDFTMELVMQGASYTHWFPTGRKLIKPSPKTS